MDVLCLVRARADNNGCLMSSTADNNGCLMSSIKNHNPVETLVALN